MGVVEPNQTWKRVGDADWRESRAGTIIGNLTIECNPFSERRCKPFGRSQTNAAHLLARFVEVKAERSLSVNGKLGGDAAFAV